MEGVSTQREGRLDLDFRLGLEAVYAHSSLAPLAQSAERLHGKEKVYGSIP